MRYGAYYTCSAFTSAARAMDIVTGIIIEGAGWTLESTFAKLITNQ